MFRQATINHTRVGAQKIWAGTVSIQPDAKTGAHHHGALESVIYVVRGRARLHWGDCPGAFIYVPPDVPHQEINANPNEVLECVLERSDNETVPAGRRHRSRLALHGYCLRKTLPQLRRAFTIGAMRRDPGTER